MALAAVDLRAKTFTTGILPESSLLLPDPYDSDPDSITVRYQKNTKVPALLRIATLNSTPMPWRASLLINGPKLQPFPQHVKAVQSFLAWKKARDEERDNDFRSENVLVNDAGKKVGAEDSGSGGDSD